MVGLLKKFLKLYGYNIDFKELSFQYQSHPSYPSMHAITGVLSHFNIDHLAVEVPVDPETLEELPKHFLAYIKSEKREDFALFSKTSSGFNVLFEGEKKQKFNTEEFLAVFSGILIVVDEMERDDITKEKKSIADRLIITLLVLSILGLGILSKPVIGISLFFLLGLLGVYVSLAIVKQELGLQSTLGNAFCSGESDTKDCDAVINSSGAMLFGLFKLSDMSLIYFAGISLLSFLSIINIINQSWPLIVGIIASAITLYSIYYQSFVVKKWCGLCLSIVMVLWLQAALAIFNIQSIANISFAELLWVSFSFLVITFIWLYLKPIIFQLKDLIDDRIKYFRFKRNFNLFNTLLHQSEPIDTYISDTSEIVFGNRYNSLPITIVTNPFCGHCKPVHMLVEDIINKYDDKVSINIRFNVNVEDINSDVVQITTRLLELYDTAGLEKCVEAMHEIYSGVAVNNWFSKWERCYESRKYLNVLQIEKEWCQDHKINFTPEILIDRRSYPKEYDRQDLIYFIEELHENYKEQLTDENSMVTA